MSRRFAALACVLLVATAGCGGVSSQNPQTTTAPTQTTATDAPEQLAPGVTAGGVQDPEALADAHLAAVENQTFVSHERIRRTNESGTGYWNATLSMLNESVWRYTSVQTGAFPSTYFGPRFDAYADGERMVYRIANETARTYGVYQYTTENETVVLPPDEVFERSYRQYYQRDFVYSLASRTDEVAAVGDGAVRLTGIANDLDLGSPEVTNVSFSMTVAADGLVESIDLTYDHSTQPTTYRHTMTFAADVTDPVEEPDWYETGLNETVLNESDA